MEFDLCAFLLGEIYPHMDEKEKSLGICTPPTLSVPT